MTELNTQPVTGGTFPDNEDNKHIVDESIWARLYPVGHAFKVFDLKKDMTTFGRKADSDYSLHNVNSSICPFTAYSSMHFTIKREMSKTGSHALIEDQSSNGTFVNGEKLGKGRVQALNSNDEISLSRKENKAFIFIDLSNKNETKWPSEISDKYTITKTLGVGAYGEVRLGFDKNTGEKSAIKIISKRKFTVNGRNQMNLHAQIMSEVEILKKLEHPCIIKIKDLIDTPEQVFIVLDLVEGGELFDRIIKVGQFDEKTSKLIFYQMVLAIKYLHDEGISHRDLKPENILLCSTESNETLIKVTDFGLSKFFDSSIMKTFCGTPNYLAPEVLLTKGESTYTNKIDNWSLGVILYICLVGYPPFSEENEKISLERQIKQGLYSFPDEWWSEISSEAKDLIRKLMCVDPVKRIELDQVLEHDWIKNDAEMKAKVTKLMYPQQQQQLNGSDLPNSIKKRGGCGMDSDVNNNEQCMDETTTTLITTPTSSKRIRHCNK